MRDLDVQEFIETVFRGWRLIIYASIIFGLTGLWIALSSAHIYRSQAIIAVAPQSTSLESSINGSALEIFGLTTSQKSVSPGRLDLALETLKSRKFLVGFARDRKIVPELLAVDFWDPLTGQLVLDNQLYNRETDKWIQWAGVKLSEPSDNDIFISLLERIIIKRTDKNGIYKIAIEHESPQLATLWVNWIIEDLNNKSRIDKTYLAETSIQSINSQLIGVSDVVVRRNLFKIIESQIIEKMLIETEQNYVFEVLDPATEPNSRIRPKRLLIIARWLSFGVLTALFILFFRVLFLVKNQD